MNTSFTHPLQRIVDHCAAWQRKRYAREICRALRDLDAHTLRDLGLDSGELGSLAAEIDGDVLPTRVRAEVSPVRPRPDRLHNRTAPAMKHAFLARVMAAFAAVIVALTLLDQVAAMGHAPEAGGAVVLARVRQWTPDSEGGTLAERPPMHSSHRRIHGG
jgi:hypothetical protein